MRTAAGDNQAWIAAAHLLSPEPVPGSSEPLPSGPPPGQLTGWQDQARASAAIYRDSPAPASGQLQPTFKLERSLSPAGPRQSLATPISPHPQGLHPGQRAGGRRWSAARQGLGRTPSRIARRRHWQAWCAALGCGGSHRDGRAPVAQGPDPVTGSQSQPMTQSERN